MFSILFYVNKDFKFYCIEKKNLFKKHEMFEEK